jgi:hypothetical protein
MSESAQSSGVPAVLALLDRVAGLLDDLGDPQAWRLDDTQTTAAVDAAYRLATRFHALAIGLLGEADRRGLPTRAGAASTQAWLRHRQRIRPPAAKRDTTLATLIPPATTADRAAGDAGEVEGAALGAALASGTVTVAQAGCVATALHELPADTTGPVRVAVEHALIQAAGTLDPAELTRLGHRVLERVDPDAADRVLADRLDREDREARRLRTATRFADGHGSVHYRLRIPEADDAILWPVLDTLARPTPSTTPTGPADPDPRTGRQRLADAFVEAFRRVSLAGGLPSNGGDRPRVVVTIPLAGLVTGLGAATNLDTGAQLSARTARRLACDAQLIPAVLDGAGQILDLGRARRSFEGPARLAVILRDQACIHPGCDRPARWCDVHHVIPWWAGGRTDQDNGVLLCGHHHKLYDDTTWGIRFAPDNIPEAIPPPWIDPHHHPIRHHRFRRRPAA